MKSLIYSEHVLLLNSHIKKSNLSIEIKKKMTSYLFLTIKYKELSVLFFFSCNISIQFEFNDLHLDVKNERIPSSYKESITQTLDGDFRLDFNIPITAFNC